MHFSAKNTLLFVVVCSLVCFGETEEGVIRKYVMEGDRVVLPCSSRNGQSLEKSVVHWKNKDGKEVFFFEHGKHSANGQAGQDEQYRGRASLFYDELKNGNASMILRDTRTEDMGNYTCVLPRVTPRGQRSRMELIVELVYKNQFGLKRGAVHAPSLKIVNVIENRVEIQCLVTGSSSEPNVEWQTCEGNALNGTGQSVPDPRGRYDTTRFVTVTETATNCFRCVVKQADIYHVIHNEIIVPEKLFEKKSCPDTGCKSGTLSGVWVSGVAAAALPVALSLYLIKRHRRRRQNDIRMSYVRTENMDEPLEGENRIDILRHNIINEETQIINDKLTKEEEVKAIEFKNNSGQQDNDINEKIPQPESEEENVQEEQ